MFSYSPEDRVLALILNKTADGDGCIIHFKAKSKIKIGSTEFIIDNKFDNLTSYRVPSIVVCGHLKIGECLMQHTTPFKFYTHTCPQILNDSNNLNMLLTTVNLNKSNF
jgi:hypothetical protein